MNLYCKIRRAVFQKHNSIDTRLQNLILQHSNIEHGFLLNPTSHNVFLYLTQYVSEICRYHFRCESHEISVLDWGAGHGHVSYLLNQAGMNVTSCDINDDRGDSSFGQPVPIIEEMGIKVDPLNHSYRLPYDSNSFDVVVSFGVLEHVSDDLNSLKEINRILKPKGLFLCFFLPYRFSWTQFIARRRGDLYHDRLYSRKRVVALLNQTRFDLVDFWQRAVLPKNTLNVKDYHLAERIDQQLVNNTPLKYLSTNVEFVAVKHGNSE